MRLLLIIVAAYAAACVAIYLVRNRVIFPLRGGAAGDPVHFGLSGGQAVSIPTADGVGISAWLLPALTASTAPTASTARPILVWFHGNGETLAALAPIFRDFRPPGVAVLAVEYRGYGNAAGTPSVDNAESDALAVGRWLDARTDLDASRLVVYGRSIGTGPAIHLAASHRIAGLIVESGFTSLRAMARTHYAIFPPFLAGHGFENLDRISRVPCPILFIHGDRDGVIPIGMGRALAERAGARGEFYVIPGADHNETYDIGGEEYVGRVREFVARVTEPRTKNQEPRLEEPRLED